MIKNKIVAEDIDGIIAEELEWETFFGKTVLVTGAAGILPSYMVYTLLALNEKCDAKINIIALVRNRQKAHERFAAWSDSPFFSVVSHDVTEPVDISGHIDFIIHAAGQTQPKNYGTDPVGTARSHAVGTDNLLRLAVKNDVEGFLYFSSCSVYGAIGVKDADETFVGRTDPLNLHSCYDEGKRMGETFCASYHHQYGVPVKILRIAHTYGPMMPLDDGRVFADFVADVIRSENIALNSDGSAVRPMMYISDAVRAFFCVMLRGKNGEAYNVVSDEYISILDLAKTLVNLYPEKNLSVTFGKRREKGYIRSAEQANGYSAKKIKALGFAQKYSVADGFKRTVDSYLQP